MQCEYIFDYQDFLASMEIYRGQSKWLSFIYLLDVWILPLLGISVALVYATAYFRHNDALFDLLSWLGPLGIVAALLLPILYRLKMKQAYRQRTALSKSNPIIFEFDDTHARFIMQGTAEVTYSWPTFTKFVESDRVAVLMTAKAGFHTIPKRAMDEAGWAVLRRCISNVR